jgi:flagellar biosynthesis protein FlhG
MPATSIDQAEGLRRLLGRQTPRVITLVSGGKGTGKTVAAVNLATALAAGGRSVLLLDENDGGRNVAAMLGIRSTVDLGDAIRGGRALEHCLLSGPEGLMVLPAGRGVKALAGIDDAGRERLVEGFARIGATLDFIVVDTAAGAASRLLPLAHPDQESILVAGTDAGRQTEAYGMLKMLQRDLNRKRLSLLVSMVATQAEGQLAFRNIAAVAQRYLGCGINHLGSVPRERRMEDALRAGRPVVEMFPHAAGSTQLRACARQILDWPGPGEAAGDMEQFVRRLILGSRLRVGAGSYAAA